MEKPEPYPGICLKFSIKRYQNKLSQVLQGVFIFKSEQILHIAQAFPLFNMNK